MTKAATAIDPVTCPLWCLIADGEFDQVCVSEASAKAERKWLVDRGCSVRTVKVIGWEAADALETKVRGY